MKKITKEKIIKILKKIEMTFDKNKKVAIFWVNDRIINPDKLAEKLLHLLRKKEKENLERIRKRLKEEKWLTNKYTKLSKEDFNFNQGIKKAQEIITQELGGK